MNKISPMKRSESFDNEKIAGLIGLDEDNKHLRVKLNDKQDFSEINRKSHSSPSKSYRQIENSEVNHSLRYL